MKQSIKISLAVAGAVALFAVASAQRAGVQSLANKPMPAFTMTDTKGKKHTNASLKGKVVLLDFWASWCGPCKAASPSMQELHTKFGSKGLVVIGANAEGSGDGMAIARKYAAEHKYTYAFTGGNEALARQLGISGLPTFIFIDRNGVVRRVEMGWGPGAKESFEDTIKRLL